MKARIRREKKKKKSEERMNKRFIVGPPGQRWIAGILDLMFLISIHAIISVYFGGVPLFFNLAINYFSSSSEILPTLLSQDSLRSGVLFFWLAFPYFLVEGVLGTSLGKSLMGLKVAGKRSLTATSARAIVRTILPLSLIDFLFVYKNTNYNQRLSDKFLELSVAMIPVKQKSRLILIDRTDLKLIIAGLFLWLIPLFSILLYSFINVNSVNPVTAPDPNSAFDYIPTMSILFYIIANNIYLAYVYYVFGGIFLLIPTILQLLFQGFLAGMMISGVTSSNWLFVLYGVLPHTVLEWLGFSTCIASGLVISETVLNLIEKYFKGKSLDDSRTYFATQMKRVLKFSFWGIILLLLAAFIETYVTPLLLASFYFI